MRTPDSICVPLSPFLKAILLAFLVMNLSNFPLLKRENNLCHET